MTTNSPAPTIPSFITATYDGKDVIAHIPVGTPELFKKAYDAIKELYPNAVVQFVKDKNNNPATTVQHKGEQ